MLTAPTRGFTLVEVLLGVTILGVLLALGAPAMGTYLQNSKLANAAATYYAGLQTARAEAVRRNVQTQFVMTNTSITTSDIANNLTPSGTGGNWVVRAASGPAAWQPALEVKAGAEGEGAAGAPAVQASGAGPTGFTGAIPFNGFGGTDGTYQIDITNPVAGTCVSAGGSIRCRRITVSPGGQIAACDPAAPTGDSRACAP